MTGLGTPIQGVTLYSFTRAFHGREYDLEGLIRKVAAEGYGPGLEVIGFSSFRGFPEIDDSLRRLVPRPRRRGRAGDHVARRERRYRHPSRSPAHAGRAHRLHDAADQGGREARLPDRSRADLDRARLDGGARAHRRRARGHPRARGARRPVRVAPAHPRSCATGYEKVGSPFLGFTMDWGATVSGFAPSLHRGVPSPRRVGRAARAGRRPLEHATTSRARPPIRPSTGKRFGSFIGLAARNGRPDLGIDFGINGTGLFGPARVDDWLEIMPWIRHVHGKFFGIDENGEEPSVPVRDLVQPARRERLLRCDLERVRGLALELLGEPIRDHRAASRPCSAPPPPMPARA